MFCLYLLPGFVDPWLHKPQTKGHNSFMACLNPCQDWRVGCSPGPSTYFSPNTARMVTDRVSPSSVLS